MELELGLGEWIIVGLSAFLFIWYFAASTYNRRRGIATYRWLYRALEGVGKITHTEWIGSSGAGARFLVEKAAKPFRKVQAIYLLEPREFLPYWAFSRMRGKRDEVKIQFTLRTAPKSLVLAQKAARSEPSLSGFQIRYEGVENQRFAEEVQSFLQDRAKSISRLELRSTAPHLEIQARIRPLLAATAESYIEPLAAWFRDKDA